MKSGLKTAMLAAASMLAGGAAHAADCKIGLSMKTLDAPCFAAQGASARKPAAEIGIGCEIVAADAQNDLNKQVSDVGDMAAQGIGALIINPKDSQSLAPAVDAAGVKVIVIDSTLDPKANFLTLVQSSNTRNGMPVGEWIAGKTADVMLAAAADGQKEAIEMIKAGTYGATGLNDPNPIASTGVDLAEQAIGGMLPARLPKLTDTTPAVITKNNADQSYKADSLF